jgi:uncharacterized protein (DUF4415 family)
LGRAPRFGSPKSGNAKPLIAIRIRAQMLAELRRLAARQEKPYQTLIHELLERAVKRVAEISHAQSVKFKPGPGEDRR